ncbi:uncharacterized protein LOC117599702 [Pangasianodon hypophthalmus]|uniref:uncharacterized protein LOC117599702 n=1 Tax=Pangasianodon hypophthalmus TaxID=310915 RepID=UPI002308247F|nr:uncharacterized protein LOC117599702 [Pangasianodon hypophthalmus]
MIALFVALYSLLCLCTAVKTSDIEELHVKTVKHGENVTMECNISSVKDKDKVVWYRQSFRKLPQFFAKPYRSNLSYKFAEGFKVSRFSITVNDHKFDLNINGMIEDDEGDYFCGEVEGNGIKFTSGTRLQYEGKEMKLCPSPGTVNKNTDSGTLHCSDSSDGKGASSRKHPIPTNQADDEDALNYAAVRFAKKPSSSRTSRDKSHEDVYAQVKIN